MLKPDSSPIVLFPNSFSPSSEQPEQHILAHKPEQPTSGFICYTKHGGIITNLNLWNPWGYVTDMAKYPNVDIWSMDYNTILRFILKNIWHLLLFVLVPAGSGQAAGGTHICETRLLWSLWHYNDVIMGTITSQITSLMIVYLTVYSDADQRKHQSSTSLAFVRGIHRRPVNSPHKGPVMRKMFPFDDVIMA